MFQLIYVSRASDVFFLKDLEQLLATARKNNQALNVTGMLLYSVNVFFQLLEGEEKIVKSLYSHIAQDRRHCEVRILASGEVDQRSFPDWQMGYGNPDPRKISSMPGFTNFFDKEFNIEAFLKSPDQAKALLVAFRESASPGRVKVTT
jgi:hypothetical protein